MVKSSHPIRLSKYLLTCIQAWCSTKVDNEGNHIYGNVRICGARCPLKDDAWTADDTLTFHHHYDEKERSKILRLFGIMASSLLLIGLVVTGLGISYEI